MKKILSLLLAMAMLFSLCPTFTMAAEAATDDVKLFDAHITGNVVFGGTLTANFSPALTDTDIANLCPGIDVEKTIASIKWSARSRYGTTTKHNVTKYLAEGTTECTIPADSTTWNTYKGSSGQANEYGIFFSVTPTDADGNALGDTIYSGVTGSPVAVDASADNKPVASGAYISPLNGDGIIGVGKTVAARFAFKYPENAGVGESGSLYTWYTSDTYLDSASISSATLVQAESTNATYTIKPADAGKWLYASIKPVAADGEVGNIAYASNHLNNMLLLYDASATQSGFYAASGDANSKYSNSKILSDNDTNTYFLPSGTSTTTELSFTLDAGKVVTFDSLFLRTSVKSVKEFVLTYSSDNSQWNQINVDSYLNTSSQLEQGGHEFDCGGVLTGRYFKASFKLVTADRNLRVQDFYPFLRNDITLEGYSDKKFASLKDGIIKVEAWGTPLGELGKKENGIVIKSEKDAEGSSDNADAVLNDGISYVEKSVTSDGEVYTAVSNPENVYITEATQNTYMKITSASGVSQYVEVAYAGDDLPEIATEKEIDGATESSATRHPIGTVYFAHTAEDGYASGKYLMKTQVYLPDYSRVELKIKQGGTGMTNGQMRNILFFMGNATPYAQVSGGMTYYQGDIGVPRLNMDTGFNYRVDKWYDLEVLLDYDKIDRSENTAISVSAWVDGIKVVDEIEVSCANPHAKNRISPAFITYPNTGLTGVKMKNSSFRQVWDADTHVTQAPVNEIKIVNTADENADAVTTLTAGTYALSNTMNVYEGNGIVDYIAKYYVTGTSTELVEVAAVRNTATDFVTVTAEELEDANKRVVLKAISFKNGLTPNYASVVVSE